MPSSKNIVELRQLLSGRFPNIRIASEPPPHNHSDHWPTGLSHLDDAAGGGLPKGGITEIVISTPASGSALFIAALLRQACHTNQLMALIDGLDSFDPTGVSPNALSRLLWVRCRNADEALKSADLILRDRNLPLVILDLQINPAIQLRKLGAAAWYRLQRIVEQTSTAFVVLTPSPHVGSAGIRLSLKSRFTLEALRRNQAELLTELSLALTHGHRVENQRARASA